MAEDTMDATRHKHGWHRPERTVPSMPVRLRSAAAPATVTRKQPRTSATHSDGMSARYDSPTSEICVQQGGNLASEARITTSAGSDMRALQHRGSWKGTTRARFSTAPPVLLTPCNGRQSVQTQQTCGHSRGATTRSEVRPLSSASASSVMPENPCSPICVH